MITYTLKVDLAKPDTNKIELPANTPYVLRLELYNNGKKHKAWDGSDGFNVLKTPRNYSAQFDSSGNWTNYTEAENMDVSIGEEDNVVLVKCYPHKLGRDYMRVLINATDAGWDTISPDVRPVDNVKPSKMARADLVLDYTSKESCSPANGGILMEGTYEDGTEFSFTIAGVENQIEEADED